MSSADLLAALWQKLHPDTVKRWVKKDDAHVAERLEEIKLDIDVWLEAYRKGVK
jgi:hypothetical protein